MQLALFVGNALEGFQVRDAEAVVLHLHRSRFSKAPERSGHRNALGADHSAQLLMSVGAWYDVISANHDPLLAEQLKDEARQAGRHLLVDHVRHPPVHKAQALCQEIHKAQPHLWIPSEEVLEVLPLHEGDDRGLQGSGVQALKPPGRERRSRAEQGEGELLARGGQLVDEQASFLDQEEPPIVLLGLVELLALLKANVRATSGEFL